MIEEKTYRMSEERLEQLKTEFRYMKTVREKEIAQQIEEVRLFFEDLPERSEYAEALSEYQKLRSKMNEVEDIINRAVIVPPISFADAPKEQLEGSSPLAIEYINYFFSNYVASGGILDVDVVTAKVSSEPSTLTCGLFHDGKSKSAIWIIQGDDNRCSVHIIANVYASFGFEHYKALILEGDNMARRWKFR
jgi:hypothetical protein